MSLALTAAAPPVNPTRQEPLRVMVVDDSVVIRGLIARWVSSESDMVVAASLRTGLDAVNQLERVNPDVAVLDIEMPETTREPAAAEIFRHDLIQKIRHLGAKARRSAPASLAPALHRLREPLSRPQAPAVAPPPLVRRAFSTQAPRALVVGSSTGGPQALMTLVTELGPVIDRFPVLITQHMPPTFTTILAEHLARSSRRPAREALDGEIIKAGQIYLAPGGRHMRVARHGADVVVALDNGPPMNFCK